MNGTYLSLFAGIGGLDLAAEALGFRCLGQVEIDEHCSRVLERHWPDIRRWGDVASYPDSRGPQGAEPGRIERALRDQPDGRIQGRPGEALGGRPDLIIGGFPCQSVSEAGRRRAQEDERWLWPEFARVIREVQPRWVFIENVPGLLSAGEPAGSALREVVWDLAQIGYVSQWRCVRASDIGAPHRRERFFFLAENPAWDADGAREFERRGSVGQRTGTADQQADRSAALVADAGSVVGSPSGEFRAGSEQGGESPARGKARAEIADAAGRFGSDASHPEDERYEWDGNPRDGREGSADFHWGAYEPAIERWRRVMGPPPHPVDEKQRLEPAFVEWLMGYPAGWTDGMSRRQALRALGNSVVPQQAIAAFSLLFGEAA